MYTTQVGKLHENKVELLLRPAFIVEPSLKFDEVPGMLGSYDRFTVLQSFCCVGKHTKIVWVGSPSLANASFATVSKAKP